MSLNGRKMQVGDIVHDILKGAGKVVNDGGGVLSVTVDFGAGGRMTFAQDGTFGRSTFVLEAAVYIPTGGAGRRSL